MSPSGLALAVLLATATLSGLLAAVHGLSTAGGARGSTRPVLATLFGIGLIACLTALIDGAPAGMLLPVGLPGMRFAVLLDPFAALMLMPVMLAGALLSAAMRRVDVAPLGALVAASTLLDLAADGAGLVLGVAGVCLALRWLASPDPATGSRARAPAALLCGGCLVGALALLGGPTAEPPLGFALLRAGGLDTASLRGAVYGLLALAAGAALSGLPPFHAGLLAMRPTATAGTGLACPVLLPVLGQAVLLRLLVDLPAAPPLWWCVLPLCLGTMGAMVGAARAALDPRLDGIVRGLALQSGGLGLVATGLVLLARASDLPVLASLSLAGLLLSLLATSLALLLVVLAADVIGVEAGSLRLDRLGGLIHRMPVTSWCLLSGLASLGGLPFTAGFAGLWLVLQAAIAGMRASGPALGLLIIAMVAGAGSAVGLGAFAGCRLFVSACLGRPRTPRGAAANDAAPPLRAALLLLAGLAGVLGLVPASGLWLVMPALRALLPDGRGATADQDGALALDVVGFAPLVLLAIVLAVALLLRWLLRARCPAPAPAESWEGGFARPPPWLPFGDPALQAGPASLAWPLAALMPGWLVGHGEMVLQPRDPWRPGLRRLSRWRLASNARQRLQRLGERGVRAAPALLMLAVLAWLWLARLLPAPG